MTEKKSKKKELEKVKSEKIMLTASFGDVYIKATKDGQIMRPVRAQMALFKDMGHFYKVKNNEYGITKPGYKHLNKVASISIVTPKSVVVDGKEQPNPHIERNPKTKLIESVFIRKMGVGYSPMGNIVVVDKTLLYNIYSYFIESIQSKMKKVKWGKDNKPTKEKLHPDCAVIGTEEDKPEKGKWAFYETVSPLGLWINYEDQAIIDCLNEHTQRQRFGDRIAQTIVERNILKDHPAIGIDKVQPQTNGKKAFVDVYGYRHENDPQQIKNIMNQAEKGSETIDIQAEVIDEITQEEETDAIKEVKEEVKEEAGNKEEEKKSPAEMNDPSEDPGFELTQEEEK